MDILYRCPQCPRIQQGVGLSVERWKQILESGDPVTVMGLQCGHVWALPDADVERIRQGIALSSSIPRRTETLAERIAALRRKMTNAFFRGLTRCFLGSCLLVSCLAYGQVSYAEKEISVHDLSSLTARSMHASDVLATSLEIVFNDNEVCCGKDSALEDSFQASDPKSLRDIANKLQGRHVLSDGRSIMVTAEYLPPDAINSGNLISMILNQHAPLMEWDSHLYVVCGVTYVETVDYSTGSDMKAIHKILLQDVRFSGSRRTISFDRLTQDASGIQGLLSIEAMSE